MNALVQYICDELEELERKVDKGGKLSGQELEYLDTLAHAKKNLLKSEEMENDGYSGNDGMYSMDDMSSYSKNRRVKRDGMGRYSTRTRYPRGYAMDDNFVSELHDLKNSAPNSQVKQKFQQFIDEIEGMM